MEQFSEDHSKLLLGKEWLIKTDSQTSTPYLFKFYSNSVDLSCCILLTDTKSVWVEVLTSNQFARRWRDCNIGSAPPYTEGSDGEDLWRTETLELLSRAHTLGAIADVSFEIIQTNFSDLAFGLEYDAFKWKWETCFLGHKASAEIISKHLIFPLISLNHLAFSSSQAIAELSDADVEKAVDRVGRTARRSVDTHIKNAISKPRMASTLRRMSAMFNSIPELPPVFSIAEKPDLELVVQPPRLELPVNSRPASTAPQGQDTLVAKEAKLSQMEVQASLKPPVPDNDDSATEESEGEDTDMKTNFLPPSQPPPSTSQTKALNRSTPAPRLSPEPPVFTKDEPDPDTSPARPSKKIKRISKTSSTDDDSDEGSKPRVAQTTGGSGPGGSKRGTRQPIKRGGKRF